MDLMHLLLVIYIAVALYVVKTTALLGRKSKWLIRQQALNPLGTDEGIWFKYPHLKIRMAF
ncbi:MAG: hypothetical protein WCJ99_04095 [Betaproteobacteria bacterium]